MKKTNHYRITKFNPKFRNDKGHFTKSDWTSIADDVKYEEYLKIETRYSKTVMECIQLVEVDKIKIKSRQNKYRPINMTTVTRSIKADDWSVIDLLVRLALREEVDLFISGAKSFYVHFGWDYYMYIGGEFKIAQDKMNNLFVENFRSPYLKKQ